MSGKTKTPTVSDSDLCQRCNKPYFDHRDANVSTIYNCCVPGCAQTGLTNPHNIDAHVPSCWKSFSANEKAKQNAKKAAADSAKHLSYWNSRGVKIVPKKKSEDAVDPQSPSPNPAQPPNTTSSTQDVEGVQVSLPDANNVNKRSISPLDDDEEIVDLSGDSAYGVGSAGAGPSQAISVAGTPSNVNSTETLQINPFRCPGVKLGFERPAIHTVPWGKLRRASNNLVAQFDCLIDVTNDVAFSRRCSQHVPSPNTPCAACEGILSTGMYHRLVNAAMDLPSNAHFDDMSHNQLVAKLRQKTAEVEKLNLELKNLQRKMQTVTKRKDNYGTLVEAIAATDYPRVSNLLQRALDRKSSVTAIRALLDKASADAYRSRSKWSKEEINFQRLLKIISGERATRASSVYLHLPSSRTVSRYYEHHRFHPAETTFENRHLRAFVLNCLNLLPVQIKEPQDLVIIQDEIALRPLIDYNAAFDTVSGTCIEHCNVDNTVPKFTNLEEIHAGLEKPSAEGGFHRAKYGSVVAIASLVNNTPVVPVLTMGCCYQRDVADVSRLMETLFDVWDSPLENVCIEYGIDPQSISPDFRVPGLSLRTKFGRIREYASDGDAVRRQCQNRLVSSETSSLIPPEVMSLISDLPGVEQRVNVHGYLPVFDHCHLIKRMRAFVSTNGIAVGSTHLTVGMLKYALGILIVKYNERCLVSNLTDPVDRMDTPHAIRLFQLLARVYTDDLTATEFGEFSKDAFAVLKILGFFSHLLLAPIETSRGIETQTTHVSAMMHLLYYCYRLNKTNFCTSQSFHDIMATWKAHIYRVAWCVAQKSVAPILLFRSASDALELFFALLRTQNHDVNFTLTEILTRIANTLDLMQIYQDHPNWRLRNRRRDCDVTEKNGNLQDTASLCVNSWHATKLSQCYTSGRQLVTELLKSIMDDHECVRINLPDPKKVWEGVSDFRNVDGARVGVKPHTADATVNVAVPDKDEVLENAYLAEKRGDGDNPPVTKVAVPFEPADIREYLPKPGADGELVDPVRRTDFIEVRRPDPDVLDILQADPGAEEEGDGTAEDVGAGLRPGGLEGGVVADPTGAAAMTATKDSAYFFVPSDHRISEIIAESRKSRSRPPPMSIGSLLRIHKGEVIRLYMNGQYSVKLPADRNARYKAIDTTAELMGDLALDPETAFDGISIFSIAAFPATIASPVDNGKPVMGIGRVHDILSAKGEHLTSINESTAEGGKIIVEPLCVREKISLGATHGGYSLLTSAPSLVDVSAALCVGISSSSESVGIDEINRCRTLIDGSAPDDKPHRLPQLVRSYFPAASSSPVPSEFVLTSLAAAAANRSTEAEINSKQRQCCICGATVLLQNLRFHVGCHYLLDYAGGTPHPMAEGDRRGHPPPMTAGKIEEVFGETEYKHVLPKSFFNDYTLQECELLLKKCGLCGGTCRLEVTEEVKGKGMNAKFTYSFGNIDSLKKMCPIGAINFYYSSSWEKSNVMVRCQLPSCPDRCFWKYAAVAHYRVYHSDEFHSHPDLIEEDDEEARSEDDDEAPARKPVVRDDDEWVRKRMRKGVPSRRNTRRKLPSTDPPSIVPFAEFYDKHPHLVFQEHEELRVGVKEFNASMHSAVRAGNARGSAKPRKPRTTNRAGEVTAERTAPNPAVGTVDEVDNAEVAAAANIDPGATEPAESDDDAAPAALGEPIDSPSFRINDRVIYRSFMGTVAQYVISQESVGGEGTGAAEVSYIVKYRLELDGDKHGRYCDVAKEDIQLFENFERSRRAAVPNYAQLATGKPSKKK